MSTPEGSQGMAWQQRSGTQNMCKLTFANDYVISHRPKRFILSYRPEGQHFHVGEYRTLLRAKAAAETHFKTP